MAKNKIGSDYHVDIEFEEKAGGVIQFKIMASSRERASNVVQHIQGEFCDVSSSKLTMYSIMAMVHGTEIAYY